MFYDVHGLPLRLLHEIYIKPYDRDTKHKKLFNMSSYNQEQSIVYMFLM